MSMYGLFDWDPPRGPGLPDETGIAAAAAAGRVLDWDPPRHAANWRGAPPAHALAAAETARGIVGATFQSRPVTWPGKGAGDLSQEQRLALWDLRVRVQLGLDSLLPLARVVPTHPGGNPDQPAQSVALTLPGGSVRLTVTRPTHDRLLDLAPHTGAQGLAGVEAAMSLRQARIDTILAADRELDLHLMESLALPAARYPYTYTLLRIVMAWASQLAQVMKHALAVPRPYHVWPGVRPMIEVPRHASYPGGHAAQAAAAAVVLADVSDAALTARLGLARLARRIGEDRVVAGLHYPIDNGAGTALGTLLGQWLMALSGTGGTLTSLGFDANAATPVSTGGPISVVPLPGLLATLRTMAEDEWR
jgi:membrane-associated phospholipid phosphatase